jgi:hypothetical protein
MLQTEGMTATTTSDPTFLLRAKQFSNPQSIPHLSRFSISQLQHYISIHQQIIPQISTTCHETSSHTTRLDLDTTTNTHPSKTNIHNPHIHQATALSISDGLITRHPYSRILTRGCETRVPHVPRLSSAKAIAPICMFALSTCMERGGCRSGLADQNMKTFVWDVWAGNVGLFGYRLVIVLRSSDRKRGGHVYH